jgi:hypothetical protein
MMHGVRVRNVRRQDFWERSGAARSAKVNTIIGSGIWLMQRRFRGGRHYKHLPTSPRTGQNDGMDLIFRDLGQLRHVLESGLKVLASCRFGLISCHLDNGRHQGSHFA